MTFKIGNKVRIRVDSEFFHEQGHLGVGEITKINRDADSYNAGWMRVEFEEDENDYQARDLQLANPTSWKEMMENEL